MDHGQTGLRFSQVGLALAFLAFSGSLLSQTAPPGGFPPTLTLQVLLSPSAGAPTPQQVVSGFKGGNAVLQGMSGSNKPQSVDYLLQRRATGDFLTYLQANPNTARAKLERFVIATYATRTQLQSGLTALQSDPNVQGVTPTNEFEFSSAQLTSFTVEPSDSLAPIVGVQYGRDDLNVDAAWELAGGYALIADVDSGVSTSHPDLVAFSGTGQFVGGNFLPVYALDVGSTPYSADVDEAKIFSFKSGSPCNNAAGYAQTTVAGHGTHVAGLIAANSTTNDALAGTCKHCGIMEQKITYYICALGPNGYQTYTATNKNAIAPAITIASDTGAQVINESFGQPEVVNYCATSQGQADATCTAIQYATTLDILLVASSGNNRTQIQFPASDSRVVAAGGFDENLHFWDDSPGSTTNCPATSLTGEPLGDECGSNYTTTSPTGQKRQELVASAHDVLSTVYPGFNWNQFGCGDGFGPGSSTDGIGWCTGTSMSAPQVSGIAGVLRSINPLVSVGDPAVVGALGIRNVLVNTTVESQHSLSWDPKFGYGYPDAAAAVRMMLGKSDTITVKNRATPLFTLYSSVATDHAYTTSPQTALALIRNTTNTYVPQGAVIAGYAAFPSDPNGNAVPAPKADIFVLTTENKPHPSDPKLVPLYMVDRGRNWPLGCTTGSSGCNSNHRDFLLVTTVGDLQQSVADGFSYRGIQGYIYQSCTPEPTCIPPYAQHLYRECNVTIDDCAIFLESSKASMESQGYTTAYPSGSSKILGYAFPNVDTDGDGLVDGFEYVIGTNPNLVDSDGDGVSDAVEFPLASVSTSDPCSGPHIQCPGDTIFKNGFQ
jgi:subtilisin family serine protease